MSEREGITVAVIPPQGGQKNYVEKPAQVYGEQYRVGQPWPVGVVEAYEPFFPAAFGPYVNTAKGMLTVHDTDWVLTNKHTGIPSDVITDELFAERFGGGGAPLAEGT